MPGIYQSCEVPPDFAARLRAMPKVEIHVHLEGATNAETVWEMSQRNRIPLPVDSLEAWKSFYEFRDFEHFIEVYVTATACMRTPDDYAALVEGFLRRQAAQNIRYSEAYFSPQLHLGRGLTVREILDALEAGADEGRRRYGSRVRIIADLSREIESQRNEVLPFALAGREKGGLFIGLGVGGIEVGYPPELFTNIFAQARNAGLHVVAHAGETAGPQSVWGALNRLGAERVGHGVRSLEDPDLIQHLRATQTPLEVSPTSNYRLKVVPPDEPHPVRQLFEAGVFVTVNSDDPPMFSTDLNQDYLTLAGQGFTWEELWRLNRNTLEASFLSDQEKEAYRVEWQAFAERIRQVRNAGMNPELPA
jgi:adenosine deaminase